MSTVIVAVIVVAILGAIVEISRSWTRRNVIFLILPIAWCWQEVVSFSGITSMNLLPSPSPN